MAQKPISKCLVLGIGNSFSLGLMAFLMKKFEYIAKFAFMGIGLKAIDFFCSGGGMSFGLQKAGIKVIAGIDYDISCKETY